MAQRSSALLAAALCLAGPACVRVQWNRAQFCRSVGSSALGELREGHTVLADCLVAFGSPLYVWELGEEGYALAYGWDLNEGWGINVSVPVSQQFSASFDFDDLDRRLYGVVLTFDGQDLLLRQREGYLAEIALGPLRRRPVLVLPEEEPEPEGLLRPLPGPEQP